MQNAKGKRQKARFVKLRSALCSFLAAIAVLFFGTTGAADDAVYLGAARCLDCHRQPGPLRQQDGSTYWVTLTEAHTWLNVDKHSLAFEVLKNDYSAAMGKRLGIDDVSNDASCLSCHAGWVKGHLQPSHIELGVSCEACHGPSSLYDLPHTNPDWRAKSADEKAALGMVDVRDAAKSAEQCLSCHIGNAAEGKVLTHAMYAAGHPPLPGFELANFAQLMPPHWRALRDKSKQIRDDKGLQIASRERAGELPEVRSVVIGGVAGLRASVRLFVDRQAWDELAGGWPDFGRYDCAACHHELELPSWRQRRQTSGRAGALYAPMWPTVLAELGLKQLERHDAASSKRIGADLNWQVTSDRAELSSIVPALDELLRELNGLMFDEPSAKALLRDICELGQRPNLDFDSARQLGWAFRAVFNAAYGQPPALLHDNLVRLSAMLELDLPSTRKKAILDPVRLHTMFDAIGDYHPGGKQGINRLFTSLKEALPK